MDGECKLASSRPVKAERSDRYRPAAILRKSCLCYVGDALTSSESSTPSRNRRNATPQAISSGIGFPS